VAEEGGGYIIARTPTGEVVEVPLEELRRYLEKVGYVVTPEGDVLTGQGFYVHTGEVVTWEEMPRVLRERPELARELARVVARVQPERVPQLAAYAAPGFVARAAGELPEPLMPHRAARHLLARAVAPVHGLQSWVLSLAAAALLTLVASAEALVGGPALQAPEGGDLRVPLLWPLFVPIGFMLYMAWYGTLGYLLATLANALLHRASHARRALSPSAMLYSALGAAMLAGVCKVWLATVSNFAVSAAVVGLLYLAVAVAPAVAIIGAGLAALLVILLVFLLGAVLLPSLLALLAAVVVAAFWSYYASRSAPAWRLVAVWLLLVARQVYPPLAMLAAAGYTVVAGIESSLGNHSLTNALPAVLALLLLPFEDLALGIADAALSSMQSLGIIGPGTQAGCAAARWLITAAPPWG